ncbi:hypothetical protein [Actinomadura oligospora]|uniref:hypothetical protein n=1 Tax=Actinomadura oligospora TaxID=111804 RepID=UPI0004AD38AB|nr:hypothetical protein [Actinomadura oligospora]
MTGGTSGPVGRAGAGGPPSVELAERVAAAVTALPDVAGLAGGRSPLASGVAPPASGVTPLLATYRAGTPVNGVAVRDDAVEIGVVARFGRPLADLADDVRAAARALAGDRRVDVLIADIVEDDATVTDDRASADDRAAGNDRPRGNGRAGGNRDAAGDRRVGGDGGAAGDERPGTDDRPGGGVAGAGDPA